MRPRGWLTQDAATSQKHIAALRKDVHISGDPSLQNALLTAQQTLSYARDTVVGPVHSLL